jgi:hypothetical protein
MQLIFRFHLLSQKLTQLIMLRLRLLLLRCQDLKQKCLILLIGLLYFLLIEIVLFYFLAEHYRHLVHLLLKFKVLATELLVLNCHLRVLCLLLESTFLCRFTILLKPKNNTSDTPF